MTSQNLGDATLTLRADTRNLDRGISSAQRKAQAFASNTRASATAIAGMTAPLAAISAIGVKTFAGFESQMSRVRGITGANVEQFKAMEDSAREMGRTTVFTATQSADALVFLGMAGLTAQDSVTALPHLLNLAAAGALELGTAADIATNIMTPFGMSAEEAGRVADVLAAAATSANTNVEQMGVAMSYAAPLAQAAGVSFEETAAAIAIMGNSDIQATRAGTAMRGGLTRLLSPTKEAAALLDQLSISTKNADGSLRPLPELFLELARAELTAEERVTIFGLRAMPGMNAVLNAAADESFPAFIKAMEDSGGTAERLAATNLDNLQGSFTLLKSGAEGAALALGAAMAPNIRKIADAITGMIPHITQWVDSNPRLAAGLAVAGTALAVLAVAAIGLSLILPGLIIMFSGLSVAAAAFGVALHFALGPIGLVILASAALVAGLILIGNHFKRTGEVTDTMRKEMSQAELALLDMRDAGVQLSDVAEKRLNRAIAETRDGFRDARIEAVAYTASLESMTSAELEQARAMAVQAILDLGKQRTIAQEELDELVEALARVDEQIADSTAESNYAIAQAEIARVVREVTQAQKDNSLSMSEQSRMISQMTDWIVVAGAASEHLGEQYVVSDGAQRLLTQGSEDLGLIVQRTAGSMDDGADATDGFGDATGDAAEDIEALRGALANAEEVLAAFSAERREARDMEKLLAGVTDETGEALIHRSLAASAARQATVDLRLAEYELVKITQDVAATEEEVAAATTAATDAKARSEQASSELERAESALAAVEREVTREAERLTIAQMNLSEVMKDVATNVSLAQQQLAFQRGEIRQDATAAETLAEITEINAQASREYAAALAEANSARTDASVSMETLAEIEERLKQSGTFLVDSTNLLAEAEDDLADASKDLADAQADVETATTNVAVAERENARAIASLKVAEDAIVQIRENHRDILRDLAQAERSVKKAREDHNKAIRAVSDAEEELTRVRAGLADGTLVVAESTLLSARRDLGVYSDNLRAAEARLTSVRSANEAAIRGLRSAEDALTAARKAQQDADDALKAAEDALRDARRDHANVLKAVTAAEEELKKARENSQDAIAALGDAESQLERIRVGLADGTAHLIDEERELSGIRSDLGAYNANITTAEANVAAARGTSAAAAAVVAAAEARLADARQMQAGAAAAVAGAESRVNAARQQHEISTNAITAAEQRLTAARENLSDVNQRIRAEEQLQAALRRTAGNVNEARLQLAIQRKEITEEDAARVRLMDATRRHSRVLREYNDALAAANALSDSASVDEKTAAQKRLASASKELVDIIRQVAAAEGKGRGGPDKRSTLGSVDTRDARASLDELKAANAAARATGDPEAIARVAQAYAELSNSIIDQVKIIKASGDSGQELNRVMEEAQGIVGDLSTSTDNLSSLRGEQTSATNAITAAERDLTKAQIAAEATSQALQDAESALTGARDRARAAAEYLQSAEAELTEAKRLAEQAADALTEAEDELTEAEEEARIASDLLTAAELALAAAQDVARTAADNLTQAEEALRVAQDATRSSADELKAAEDAVTLAHQAVNLAANNLKTATDNLTTAQDIAKTSADNLKLAQDAVKAAHDLARTAAELLDTATANLDTAQTDLTTTADALSAAEAAVDIAQAAAKLSADELKIAADNLEEAQDNAKETTNNLKKAQDGLKTALNLSTTAAENLKTAIDNLQNKTITITTIYVTRGSRPSGGGSLGGGVGGGGDDLFTQNADGTTTVSGAAVGDTTLTSQELADAVENLGQDPTSTYIEGNTDSVAEQADAESLGLHEGGIVPGSQEGVKARVGDRNVTEVVAPLDDLPKLLAKMGLVPLQDVMAGISSGLLRPESPVSANSVIELVIHNHMNIAGHEFEDLQLDTRRSLVRQNRW